MDKIKKIKLLAGLAAVLLCGVLYLFLRTERDAGTVVTESFSDTPHPEAGTVPAGGDTTPFPGGGKVYIHVCGEVKKPGVYIFHENPRVIEAVEKAGGFTRKADQASVNQAEEVTDGTRLMIPSKRKQGTGAQAEDPGAGSAGQTDKVNINTAAKEELMTLSGIGESKAAQILSYREEHGAFQKIEDIMNISGIKEGVFGRIRDRITV